jgi:hypothetical protein
MVLKPMGRLRLRGGTISRLTTEYTAASLPMFFLLTFDVFKLASQVFVRCQHLPQPDKRTNDQHIHLNGAFALQHRAQHHHAVLSERIG